VLAGFQPGSDSAIGRKGLSSFRSWGLWFERGKDATGSRGARGVPKVPVLPHAALRPSGAHDQADRGAGDRALRLSLLFTGSNRGIDSAANYSGAAFSASRTMRASWMSLLVSPMSAAVAGVIFFCGISLLLPCPPRSWVASYSSARRRFAPRFNLERVGLRPIRCGDHARLSWRWPALQRRYCSPVRRASARSQDGKSTVAS
jgi:hypothetical protein